MGHPSDQTYCDKNTYHVTVVLHNDPMSSMKLAESRAREVGSDFRLASEHEKITFPDLPHQGFDQHLIAQHIQISIDQSVIAWSDKKHWRRCTLPLDGRRKAYLSHRVREAASVNSRMEISHVIILR